MGEHLLGLSRVGEKERTSGSKKKGWQSDTFTCYETSKTTNNRTDQNSLLLRQPILIQKPKELVADKTEDGWVGPPISS